MSFRSRFLVHPLVAAICAALPFSVLAIETANAGVDESATELSAPSGTASGDGRIVTLPRVVAEGDRASIAPARQLDPARLDADRAATSDTATLLDRLPGVSIQQAGGVSGLPAIHGLGDDRLRVLVDGADVTASCPNHMNPALSYLPPSDVARITVYPGVVPVSKGGDSIGGSIVVESDPPAFAAPGEAPVWSGEIGAHYRSNGDAHGASVEATYATERFRLHYAGSTARADNYHAGGDFKSYLFTGRDGHTLDRDEVGSSSYVTHNQRVDLAYTHGDHLLEARLGWQSMPKQGFPNQRMDLTDNRQRRAHLRYVGDFDGVFGGMRLELKGYRETLEHAMDFGEDKRFWYGMASGGAFPPGGGAHPCAPIGATCASGMPMRTESDTTALSADADITFSGEDHLRFGLEFRRYRLDDWWPASGGMMAPETFWNIRDGRRDRDAAYLEWSHRVGERSELELGVRHERVRMDAGEVNGYAPASNMMGSYQMRDAALFNARDRERVDGNWDATALYRVTLGERTHLALGLARKTRSPGLYETYPWSTWSMAAVMNNVAGDGNGYIGNPDLRPERAVTVSATLDHRSADGRREIRFTPYVTRVADYIDAVQWDAATNAPRTTPLRDAFGVLRYANQSARIHGFDLSGRIDFEETRAGVFGLEGELAWHDGENPRTGDALYQQMPLHARLALTWRRSGWEGAVEAEGVARKDRLSDVRNEIGTAGYGLLNLRVAHEWSRFRVDVGVDNVFDRLHALPTGGAYLGQGSTMTTNPLPPNEPRWGQAVPGPGRSIYTALRWTF